jgi:hypothetical protein
MWQIVLLFGAGCSALTMSLSDIQAAHDQARREIQAMSTRPLKSSLDGVVSAMSADLNRMTQRFGDAETLLQVSGNNKAVKSVVREGDNSKGKRLSNEEVLKKMKHLSEEKMPEMLVMLKQMYQHFKGRIGSANKAEHKSKERYNTELKSLEEKKDDWRKAVSANEVSDTYDMLQKHLKRERELSHRQYRTGLQVSHAGMDKLQTVISVMEKAIKDHKVTTEDMHKLQKVAPPAEVLLQLKSLVTWARQAHGSLRAARGFAAQ